ncbi:putative mitochondrial hypothetical protein [Leptomonas pyrrhocoris]|uniref:Uncharacterized protein n=1 Tax=Leptomonas pyrrhocoris TaxID=157538 RepID=A0A0M9FXD1_LEPPY|nr:putative mitochondrial hypothetical protein [Leptomonas pyrrhocoris]XP_015656265.1 putative mitochondrial hypothetical protein [Leptomonas pyrrhocoris]KPA77825.1 putative mitochondrial hypothetical protein [Leptomonas pyrrhocoris]KPA77826.1 putative mitochondrial hypothetical protein [Leptomonas pyrrhocoris]|eukprot:XP_015656264.1 putative mitochondrial hypothetical protein [Leptomonas pyrrhocoris]
MWRRTPVLRFVTTTAALYAPPSSSSSSASSTNSKPANRAWSVPPSILKWYPRQAGEFLANCLTGHSAFIHDIPNRFDRAHARHFSFVEALTITPLYTLTMVHYFSLFCQYPTRVEVLKPMLEELGQKSDLQYRWLCVLQDTNPVSSIAWRCALLTSQLLLFPAWLLLSSAAPQLVHATVSYSCRILHTKYSCISTAGNRAAVPAFVAKAADLYAERETFHEAQAMALPTDFGVAIIMLFLIIFLTS